MANISKEYKSWLNELKQHIHSTQIRAALKVNAELLGLYWHLGQEILNKEKDRGYGKKLIDQLSKDLMQEFPQVKGFSRSNLYSVRQWVSFYAQNGPTVQSNFGQLAEFGQSVGNKSIEEANGQMLNVLFQIPWGHHLQIISKCKRLEEAIFYVKETGRYNWSCNVLLHQIESKLWERQGKAITNFEQTLPAPQSDLARELIKDPYSFDFLNLAKEHKERDLESALMDNITKFLLELGAGFSFIGRQYPIKVGDKEFAIDLLFYHYKLRCFVVVELKAGEFIPEHSGKLNFYLNVVDDMLRQKEDNATLGILICKQRNEIITEYALRGINRPMGISEYQFTARLPESLKDSLPTIEQIEEHLSEPE
jgi:predicted nuclease of restriction endonuclease-like (RecB) superfamily